MSTNQINMEQRDSFKGTEMVAQEQNNLAKTGLDKKQRIGIGVTAMGSLICFVSCILTMLDTTGEYHGLVLYGFTSIGVTAIVAGFYLIFEP